jgi:hypothetical protein
MKKGRGEMIWKRIKIKLKVENSPKDVTSSYQKISL